MKRNISIVLILPILMATVISCATQQGQYNTQKGAAVGAGIGALLGQIIGQNTESTVIGMSAGTLIGAIIGNAADQSHQAAVDAAKMNKRIVYYDEQGRAVEAIPNKSGQQTQCKKVTKRIWDNGQLVSETIEEICEGEKTTGEY